MSGDRRLQMDEGGVLWGVRHSHGIRWCGSETQARADMATMADYDRNRQIAARGFVRLVRRALGPIEVVENPYVPNGESKT